MLNITTIIMQTALSRGLTKEAAALITAQAVHESGNFTSHNFKVNNNLYGITVAHTRPAPYQAGAGQKQPDGNANYAKYNNVSDSVNDLIDLLKYDRININAVKTPQQYASALKAKGYFGDSVANYAAGLARNFKTFAIAAITPAPGGMFDEKKKYSEPSINNLFFNINRLFSRKKVKK